MKIALVISVLVWFSCIPVAAVVDPFIGVAVGGIGLVSTILIGFFLLLKALSGRKA
jgi:hypothetical protein